MSRPRLPKTKAEVSGSSIKDPGRFKSRSVPKGTRHIGPPYVNMTAEQQEAWADFVDELPWLNSSHRAVLRVACILRVRVSADDAGINAIQTYSAVLSKLGATPSDESKIDWQEDDDDLADAFFRRAN